MTGTEFIHEDFCVDSSAATEGTLQSYARPTRLLPRHTDFPSLDSTFLTHYGQYTVGPVLTSRMAAVLADILEVRKTDPEAKFLIFSQYSESLKEAMSILLSLNVTHRVELNDILFDCAIVEGKDTPKDRERNLKRFTEVLSCNVCLLTIGAAAAGLTLTAARVCYLLEPTHSAADEAQVN